MFFSRLNYVQHLRLSIKNVYDSLTRVALHKILTTTYAIATRVPMFHTNLLPPSSGTLNSVYPHN